MSRGRPPTPPRGRTATRTAEFEFGDSIDEGANAVLHGVARALLARDAVGVLDVVPAFRVLAVEYDPRRVDRPRLERWVRASVRAGEAAEPRAPVEIPVDYAGPDLADVAAATGLSPDEVVRVHAGRTYRVFAIGFTPGFPFLGPLDERIRLPRRTVPRPRVEAHSVAIAHAQTGIYPLASPGGWHLIGTSLVPVYDPHRPEPFLLEPGDRVRFVAAAGARPAPVEPLELLPSLPRTPALEVVRRGVLDLVVDAGRFMAGRFGLARSGPLDAESARRANRLLGNAATAPVVELNLGGPVLRAVRETRVAIAGYGLTPVVGGRPVPAPCALDLRRGDVLAFRAAGRGARCYLALPGGLESARYGGSASVDVRGLIGRPLRRGDLLGQQRRWAPSAGFAPGRPVAPPALLTVRVLPGPQFEPDAWAALRDGTFIVDRADRMGIRLDGPSVPGGEVVSEPTRLGAVQVTAGGHPMILLHDRGTLGGYAKPFVVDPRDLHRVGQLRAGDAVRFRAASPLDGRGTLRIAVL
jgi:KipI family sensor histidine kinase inhibitor